MAAMISLGALVVAAILALVAFAAGSILVGSARAGELTYLRQRVGTLEAELTARPREADVEHLRLDLVQLRTAHGTAVAQVIALADAAAHNRLNPRKPGHDVDPEGGSPRSFDPGVHRDGEDPEWLSGTPRYHPPTEEEIRAEFDLENQVGG